MSRKKKINKQTIVGIISLILATLIVFVAIPVSIGAMGNTTEIVRVSQSIPVGKTINETNTEVVEVSNYNLPNDLIKNQNDAIGKHVTARLETGDYILKSKITSSMISTGNYQHLLNGEKQIISVAIKDLASGISGKIQAGDIVSVYNNAEIENGRAKEYKELKYVKVLAVTTTSGMDTEGTTTSGDELPATVTLLVNENQAQLLSGIDKNGNIHFSLIYSYSGDGSKAEDFLKKQDDYFKTSGKL